MSNFSLLISVYAKENSNFFDEALHSVCVKQSIIPTEIVLVQDGPIGRELNDVLDRYIHLTRFVIIKLENNLGLSRALNIGLKACSHELVIRMDADDVCEFNRFEILLDFCEKKPHVDVVGSYAMRIDDSSNILGLLKVPSEDSRIKELIWTCPLIHPTVAYKKSKILSVGSYREEAGPRQDDYDLWFRCCRANLIMENIPTALLMYRVNDFTTLKNTRSVGLARLMVALKYISTWRYQPRAYLGVILPLIRAMLPYKISLLLGNVMFKFNPRNQ